MAKRKSKFIHKPVYPGGMEALQKFLRKHLRYPAKALAEKVEGSVKVDYSLNQSGKVIKVKAVEGPKSGCREEAERLVKLLRFHVPKDYKMTVQYHQHLTINFKLPKAKPKPKSTQVKYTITPNKKAAPKPATGTGYGYTIKW